MVTVNSTFTLTASVASDIPDGNVAPSVVTNYVNVWPSRVAVGDTVHCDPRYHEENWTCDTEPAWSYQWHRGGVDIAGATSQSYTLVGDDLDEEITCTVTGTNSEGSDSATSVNRADVVTAPSTPASFSQGWDESIDLGTDGDVFVDTVNGSNSNNGLTSGAAKQTIAAGMAALSSGGTLRIMGDGVTYREAIVYPPAGTSFANKTKVLAYGTDRPIISGAKEVSGWTQCSAADAAVLGSTLGVASSPVYKKTIAESEIPGTYLNATNRIMALRALNLHENGQQCYLAYDWDGGSWNNPSQFQWMKDWHTASSVAVNGSNIVTGYTDTSVTDSYTKAQLDNAFLIGLGQGNFNQIYEIDFDTGTDEMQVSPAAYTYNPSHALSDNYALFNILPNMTAGTWGWVDNGSTIDLYLYPHSGAPTDVEYSDEARPVGAYLYHPNVELAGFHFTQFGGKDTFEGSAIAGNVTAYHVYGQHIHDNKITNCTNGFSGQIYFKLASNCDVVNNTIENCYNSRGIEILGITNAPAGGGGQYDAPWRTIWSGSNLIARNHIYRIDGDAVKPYASRETLVAHNLRDEVGQNTHMNKDHSYFHGMTLTWFGNRYKNTGGYWTTQAAAGVALVLNDFDGDPRNSILSTTSNRLIGDQSGSAEPVASVSPAYDWPSMVINNSCIPDVNTYVSGTISLTVTSIAAADANLWTVKNNLIHGYDIPRDVQIDTWSNNWNTGADGAYTGNGTSSNDTATTIAAVYENAANNDFTFKAGGAILTAAGDDVSAEMDQLRATYGAFFADWARDAHGDAWDETDPHIGASAQFKSGDRTRT